MKLTINKEIIDKVKDFCVIAYTMDVDNQNDDIFNEVFLSTIHQYENFCSINDVVNIPKIKASRDGYKKLKKDPSHTRLACEALLRRVIKGDGLYRLGNIIDAGNLLSLQTLRSVCVVDLDKLNGDIIIRLGKENDEFIAINRGLLNITNIPVYCDNIGMFGTPTSDTNRTKIDNQTSRILVMIIMFDQTDYQKDEMLLKEMFIKHIHATNLKKIEVQYGK